MKDIEGTEIKPGNVIRYSYGIPPTTVDLFVAGPFSGEVAVTDKKGQMMILDEDIAKESRVVFREVS